MNPHTHPGSGYFGPLNIEGAPPGMNGLRENVVGGGRQLLDSCSSCRAHAQGRSRHREPQPGWLAWVPPEVPRSRQKPPAPEDGGRRHSAGLTSHLIASGSWCKLRVSTGSLGLGLSEPKRRFALERCCRAAVKRNRPNVQFSYLRFNSESHRRLAVSVIKTIHPES